MATVWTRKEYVTRSSDPTTVVEWEKNGTRITEFQNIYVIIGSTTMDLAAELHKALETINDLQNDMNTADQDGNPDAKIYGGM